MMTVSAWIEPVKTARLQGENDGLRAETNVLKKCSVEFSRERKDAEDLS